MESPLRVVICDDSLGFPTLLRTWLREDGRFEVVGMATGGERAKDIVAEQHPDAIVLDLVLPDAPDSPALVRALRERHPPLRVMMISSLHNEALQNAANAAGADGFCNKGATAAELTERLYVVATAGGSSTENRLP
ncbi:MAG: response regulator transcription factor [Solirubrobacteraceae bacterium]